MTFTFRSLAAASSSVTTRFPSVARFDAYEAAKVEVLAHLDCAQTDYQRRRYLKALSCLDSAQAHSLAGQPHAAAILVDSAREWVREALAQAA